MLLKHSLIFTPDNADVSKKATLNSLASFYPSSLEMTRSSAMSALLAKI